ncbi:MAG: M20/M25/M40 family metallo-hydrolase [Bacteroidetes bacterium]|nr:M20/M25/M40 family metallo-hydrolase [Bacteroidota bacterium]
MTYAVRCIVVILFAQAITAQEKVDSAMMVKIRDEGLNRSQAKEILSWITDVYGPRLTGSQEYNIAANWTKNKFTEMGMQNSHLESWGPFGKSWKLKEYSATLIGRQTQPLISYPKAWSPGLKGNVVGEVIYFDADSLDQIDAYKGKLKGKYVLFTKPNKLNAYFNPPATRTADSSLLQMANAEPPVPGKGGFNFRQTPEQKQAALVTFKKWELILKENPAAVLTSAPAQRNEGGSVFVMGATVPVHPDSTRIGAFNSKALKIPTQIEVGAEHYNRMVRMVQKGEKIKLAVELDVEMSAKDDSSYNVIAEIPGGDLKDEIVMIGGHLDSWHGGTGATDDGTGSTVVMEAMRILKTIGAKPRRTIRAALWGGEEQGLLGSRGYVKQHFGVKDTLKFEAEKFSAYFNNDNGTGKVRGIYMQGNEQLRPIFRAWLAPFKDLGATTITPMNTGGTDHQAFDGVGLPGFQFIQDPIEYGTRTWHSTMDVFDRAQEDDMKQAAILMAAFAYNAAMRDEKLPRKPSMPSTPQGTVRGFEDENGHSH